MHDFIAIGDIVTDAFIKLKTAETTGEPDTKEYKLCMQFGDKIPYESVEVIRAVGNSANAAVSASRLGINSALITNIGDDLNGQECLESLIKDGVETKFIQVHKGQETNYHYVLWFKDDRTILVKHQEYDRIFPDIGEPKWLYLSSLGENTLEYHHQISEYLFKHPKVSLAFQPGTFQMKFGVENLKNIYTRTNIFFCNVEEAGRILEIETLGIPELLKRLHSLGPKTVVITDGPKGAYVYDGENTWFVPPYPDIKPPFERTGAGDAFASTIVGALILGKTLPEALSWGAVNSMSVVQQVGAQKGLLPRKEIEKYLLEALSDFKVKNL